jgi:AcrR family transcriptional regulator
MINTDAAAPSTAATSPLPLQPDQILAVTRQSLREFGYEATTIRRIARMLGCAVGSIYRFFRDKRELLMAVAQQQLEPAAETEQLSFEQSVRRYLELVAVDSGAYWMMFWLVQGSGSPGELPPVVERIIAGWSRKLDDEAKAKSAWAMVHGCLSLGYDADEIVRLVNVLVGGKSSSPRGGRVVNRVIQNVYVPKAAAGTLARSAPPREVREVPVEVEDSVEPEEEPVEVYEEEEEFEDVCLL